MAPEAQASLFDFYQATLEALMDKARRDGVLGERCRRRCRRCSICAWSPGHWHHPLPS